MLGDILDAEGRKVEAEIRATGAELVIDGGWTAQ